MTPLPFPTLTPLYCFDLMEKVSGIKEKEKEKQNGYLFIYWFFL